MPETKNVHEALLILQAEPIVLKKDQQGQVGNQKTRYADLVQANAVILPKLAALGVLWLTAPTLRMVSGQNGQEDPRFVLDWELRHVASDTAITGSYPLMDAGTAMKAGSSITYARRYALVAVTNAVADDDDDDGAGYANRRGYASRANIPQEVRGQAPAPATAQRGAQPRVPAERARPAQQPDIPAPAPEGARRNDPNGPWTQPMMRKWMAQNREAGIEGGDIKQYATDMLGREIGSSNEITFGEMRGMIDAFEKALKDRDTAAATVIEIYRRASGPVDGGAPGPETVPTAEQAELGHPPAKRTAAAKKAAPAARRSTRESVTGIADPNGEPAPWENEPPADDWPETAQPPQ